jgi:Ala-tRNA(Pro) deacylase
MTMVTQELMHRGLPFEILAHGSSASAFAEARELGVEAEETLKTVVVDTDGHHALVVVPASRRVDMHRVEDALGDHRAHLATEDELQRDFPDVELGAFPPMGSIVGVETLVDPHVFDHETIVFAAGTRTESVKMRTADLFREEPVVMAPLVKEPEEEA